MADIDFRAARVKMVDGQLRTTDVTKFEVLAAFLSVPREKFDGAETREVEVRIAGEMRKMSGLHYLVHVGLAHFFFHVTTAYALARHNGVEIGKRDYMGKV